MYNHELYHYGVKGMKWGHRKARGHAGPGKYATKKRQQAGDKRDLDALNKGQHLSVGLTKKRQAKFDARDKAAIEKRMAKNEAELNDKPKRQRLTSDQKKRVAKAVGLGAATVAAGLAAGKLFESVVMDTDLQFVRGADTAAYILGGYVGGMAVGNIYNAVENRKR